MARMNEDETRPLAGSRRAERWTYACAKQLLERVIFATATHAGLRLHHRPPVQRHRPAHGLRARRRRRGGPPRARLLHERAAARAGRCRWSTAARSGARSCPVDDFVDGVLRIGSSAGGLPGRDLQPRQPAQRRQHRGAGRGAAAELPALRARARRPARVETVSAEAFYGPGYDDSQQRVPDIEKARAPARLAPAAAASRDAARDRRTTTCALRRRACAGARQARPPSRRAERMSLVVVIPAYNAARHLRAWSSACWAWRSPGLAASSSSTTAAPQMATRARSLRRRWRRRPADVTRRPQQRRLRRGHEGRPGARPRRPAPSSWPASTPTASTAPRCCRACSPSCARARARSAAGLAHRRGHGARRAACRSTRSPPTPCSTGSRTARWGSG